MSGLTAIYIKEIRQYLATPIPYVLMAVFWGLMGYYFSFNVFFVNVAQMVNAFHNMSIMLLLIVPLITMRIFAEENRSNTIELLMTLPLDEVGIVLGKYLAALTLLSFMLIGTTTALVPLTVFGQPDLGPILGGYIGIFLLGAMFLAIGILISCLCENQLVAALVTWAVLLIFWYVDYVSNFALNLESARLIRHLSFSIHYVDLIRGLLPIATIVYFVTVIVFATVLTIQILKAERK